MFNLTHTRQNTSDRHFISAMSSDGFIPVIWWQSVESGLYGVSKQRLLKLSQASRMPSHGDILMAYLTQDCALKL